MQIIKVKTNGKMSVVEEKLTEVNKNNLYVADQRYVGKYIIWILSDNKSIPVQLKAGYGDSTALLFKGDLQRCDHVLENLDWRTTLTYGDGLKAAAEGRISESFPKGVGVLDVIKSIAKTLPGVDSGDAIGELSKVDLPSLNRGLSLAGPSLGELTKILTPQGLFASIQDSVLQIQKKNKPVTRKAVLLNKQSGLLSVGQQGTDGKIKIKTLLMSELQAGRLVVVGSEEENETYIMNKCVFTGSNYSNDWFTEIEAKKSK